MRNAIALTMGLCLTVPGVAGEPVPANAFDEIVWQYVPLAPHSIVRCWSLDPGVFVCTTGGGSNEVRLVSSTTGDVLAKGDLREVGLPFPTYAAACDDPNEILLLWDIGNMPRTLGTFDTTAGRIRDIVRPKFDARIHPLRFDSHYVYITPPYRGGTVTCVDGRGTQQWQCRLPGYVRIDMARCGPLLVAQTRTRHGGPVTSCVDLRTGRLLWAVASGFGQGATFTEDASCLVENAGGQLVGRDPSTGMERWRYRSNGVIPHAPVCGLHARHVFAVSEAGVLVCVNARDGSVIWQRQMASRPQKPTALDYFTYHPAIFASHQQVMLIGCDGHYHIVSARDGTESAILAKHLRGPVGKPAGRPFFTRDLLVIPSTRCITAYRPPWLQRQTSNAPVTPVSVSTAAVGDAPGSRSSPRHPGRPVR